MLQRLQIKNLTVYQSADLHFGRHLNVFVGENGAGKSHLLKIAYTYLALSAAEGRKPQAGGLASAPTKSALQSKVAEKLVKVFRPESLGRLARRQPGRQRCDIALSFSEPQYDLSFSFATQSTTEVTVNQAPNAWLDASPAYLPTRELLTIFPNFVSFYEGHYLEFEETWRDTCVLLGAPLKQGVKEKRIRELLAPIEDAMQGSIELDRNGRFYLRNARGRMEMPLVAEGLRKLGMLSRLIATGALLDKGALFWDEPEANLNPKLIRRVAKSIVDLSANGIQVFIASHSLFLLHEIEALLTHDAHKAVDARFFGLHRTEAGGVEIYQGRSSADMGPSSSASSVDAATIRAWLASEDGAAPQSLF
ncbi:ATP/GTP-binding protein [Leptothrix ochracea]|uniref:AAA family ATPase n=1 Tax=Leptothrix ochracea TaxID=735331 RepID=UPI0034E19BDD